MAWLRRIIDRHTPIPSSWSDADVATSRSHAGSDGGTPRAARVRAPWSSTADGRSLECGGGSPPTTADGAGTDTGPRSSPGTAAAVPPSDASMSTALGLESAPSPPGALPAPVPSHPSSSSPSPLPSKSYRPPYLRSSLSLAALLDDSVL